MYIVTTGHVFASPYYYLEFLVKLVHALQLQGFRNPAVFALDYVHAPMSGFAGQLSQASMGWNYLIRTYPDSNLALLGDSTGASLGLGLLLHIAKPAFQVTPAAPTKPHGAVFISPICQSFHRAAGSDPYVNFSPGVSLYSKIYKNTDYMTPELYSNYGKLLGVYQHLTIPENALLELYQNPGLCRSREWWGRALPSLGTYIIYGDDEILRPEIEEMYFNLMRSGGGNIRVAGERGQLHNWPVFQLMAGRSVEDREAGIDSIAINLAHMILWRDLTLLEREDQFEQHVLRKMARRGYC